MCPVIMERRGSPYRMLPSRLPGSEIAGDLAGVEFRNNNAYGSKVYLSAFTEKTKQRLALSGSGPEVDAACFGCMFHRVFESHLPDQNVYSSSRFF